MPWKVVELTLLTHGYASLCSGCYITGVTQTPRAKAAVLDAVKRQLASGLNAATQVRSGFAWVSPLMPASSNRLLMV